MLILCSVRNLQEANLKLFIARIKPKNLSKEWLHVPLLAPSSRLFYDYLTWRHKGLWPKTWPEYEKRFNAEMSRMTIALTRVEEKYLQKEKSVAMACYCNDFKYCHRSIIGKYFSKLAGNPLHFSGEMKGDYMW